MQITPKAFLFDFDGVIVDSEPLHCQSYLETAATMDIPLTQEQYYAELIGFDDRGAVKKLYQLFERKLDPQIMASFIEQKSKISLSLIRAGKFRPLEGVDDFVKALAERCGMGICSGALRSEIEGMLDGIGLRQFFSVVTAAEDVTIGKPDPSGYILTAKRLGEMMGRNLLLGECLVIEDAPSVALRARDVGFSVLGVTTTYRAEDWPREIPTVNSLEPSEVLKKFLQLPLEKRT
ncbi:MAG: HAD family phosphatase [Anaerolineae bacterium]|nr:HAD family phosphatase [Phycisphaerae bacterium]